MPSEVNSPTVRTALYARVSSDLQSAASIDDQLRICAEWAAKQGWLVVGSYADQGISGASLIRPGIQKLLQDAAAGKMDVIVTEALDRMSRDQEDIAHVYKRLRFLGARIVTLSEGEVSELHIGLKGTMGALYLKDLADKTRRGLRGERPQQRDLHEQAHYAPGRARGRRPGGAAAPADGPRADGGVLR